MSRAVGARLPRLEDARLLSGRGQFVADVRLPRMTEVYFLRSPVAHARIVAVDTARARSAPGVLAVLTAADLPAVTLANARHPNLRVTPQPVLAVDKVRYVGEPVAAIVAVSRYAAEDAADLVDVDYDELPCVTALPGTTVEKSAWLFDDIADNVVFQHADGSDDVDAALTSSAHVVSGELRFHRQVACPLEPRGTVADFDAGSGLLTMWASTQSPHRLQREIATAIGMANSQVRVVMHDIGGGFGQKIPPHVEEIATALSAMHVGRPVRWIEDRCENLVAAPHARDQLIRIELGLDDELRFTALRGHVLGNAGAYSSASGSALTEAYRAARTLTGTYKIRTFAYDVAIGLTNSTPIAPYRGVGLVAGQAARELVIDKAARLLGVDRFDLRRRNLIDAPDQPYTTAMGMVYDDVSFRDCLDEAERLLGDVDTSADTPGAPLVGVGISPYVEPSGLGTQGGLQLHGHHSPSHDSARVSLDSSGHATVSVGTPSLGTGLETSLAQVAADALGLPVSDVVVRWSDTAMAPVSLTGTRGSRALVVASGAVALAAADIREQLLQIGGELLELDPRDLRLEDGFVHVTGDPSVRLSVREVAEAAFTSTEARRAVAEPTLVSTRLHDPGASYSNACVVAIVEVQPATGQVRVRRVIGVEDCGTMVNPTIVEGQFVGAVAQAIGSARLERMAYDEQGQPLTSTLMDYLLPTSTDTVDVETVHITTPSAVTWRGVKGIGESGMIGTVAAIASAIAAAVSDGGGEVTELPLLPEQVWRMLQPADHAQH
ncbi:MAG: molybdopterin-dependent oxidoreductase [Propionibacteriales bacterium]|nr:molybdopterin-dependent oxidoreductase [Propionibacteriales bacterium]